MNRKTVIKILICLAAVVLAWLAARFLFPVRDGVQAIRERGVLRVGTAGDYQPMSFLDPETGSYVGFDAALAEDLGEELGVRVEYVPTSWPTLMEDTLAGKFDLAMCGITITDARKEQALMSDGYFENGKTVLCRKEDEDKYTSLEAVNQPDVRVMENPGGLNEKFARENLPDAQIIIHDVNEESFSQSIGKQVGIFCHHFIFIVNLAQSRLYTYCIMLYSQCHIFCMCKIVCICVGFFLIIHLIYHYFVYIFI